MNTDVPAPPHLPDSAYQALAEFRYQIRQFLLFSERIARAHDLEPQQHQLLLALKGLPEGKRPTIAALAERLGLQHHSTVELVSRLAERGAVERTPGTVDKREVLVRITPKGEEILHTLSVAHHKELTTTGPALAKALRAAMRQANESLGRTA